MSLSNQDLLARFVGVSLLCLSPLLMAYYGDDDSNNQHYYTNHDQYYDPYGSHEHHQHFTSTRHHKYREAQHTRRSRSGGAVAQHIPAPGNKTVKINLSSLTWAAYTPDGTLVRSGPVSGGKAYCPDIKRGCRTPTGTYTVYRKQGPACKSSKFPVGKGGAKMPYCMHFNGGYAMHGSNSVPGYNASHGCVRMLVEDAKWLNQEFVNVGSTKVRISN